MADPTVTVTPAQLSAVHALSLEPDGEASFPRIVGRIGRDWYLANTMRGLETRGFVTCRNIHWATRRYRLTDEGWLLARSRVVQEPTDG